MSDTLIEQDKEFKGALEKYRHLEKGMEIVERTGRKEALKFYKSDPLGFEAVLT